MRLDFSGYDVSVSEHCGPFRPLGMKSAWQIDICFKIEGSYDGNTFSLHSWFTPQPYFLRRLARNGSVIMDGLSAESGIGHRGDSRNICHVRICWHIMINEWHSKDTFFRESHVGMLTQHEVFLQAGVQVWVFDKALILIRFRRIIRKVFRLPRIQIKISLEVEINTKVLPSQ